MGCQEKSTTVMSDSNTRNVNSCDKQQAPRIVLHQDSVTPSDSSPAHQATQPQVPGHQATQPQVPGQYHSVAPTQPQVPHHRSESPIRPQVPHDGLVPPTQPQTPEHGLVSSLRSNCHPDGRPNSAPPHRMERMVEILHTMMQESDGTHTQPINTQETEGQGQREHDVETVVRISTGAFLRSMGDQYNASTLARSLRMIGDHYDFESTVRRTLSYGDLDRVAHDSHLIHCRGNR